MNERKYVTAYVNEPQKVLKFLTKNLDFSDHRHKKKAYIGKEGVVVGNRFGNNYLLLSNSSPTDAEPNLNETVVFETDNCLRDYHQLNNAGITIEKIPRYTSRGLEVMISDDNGNRFLLLEKREYSEI